jgi:hypothetical protein
MVKRRYKADSNNAKLLLLMGRLLALMNEAEPLPEDSWGNWFVEEIQALFTPKTAQNLQEIALMVQKALRMSSYKAVDDTLRQAIDCMQRIVGESETAIFVNDPHWLGKQVIYRMYQEGERIIYGKIEASLVFPNNGSTSDVWVVKVQSGFQLNAESNAFVLYDGPHYQPGEQVFYVQSGQHIAAKILGPGFGMRGHAGFNISFQKGGKEEYRYAVPSTDLSYDA